jgi:iron complex transport system substrate-binding protein
MMHMFERRVVLFLSLFVALLAAAPPPTAPPSLSPSSQAAMGARAPGWYRDNGAARARTFRRIVSLAPVVTETLFAVGAGDRVIGVTRFCDRPASVRALPKVGGYVDASLEAIVALRPDLVIAMPSMAQRTLLDRLRERDVQVLVVFADSLEDTQRMIVAVGDAVGAAVGARQIVDEQSAALALLAARARGRGHTVAVVVGLDPLVVAGPETFADAALRATGAASAVRPGDPPWPQWYL